MNEQPAPKRYLLFAGSDYYPDGGWRDFEGSFDSAEAAAEAAAGVVVRLTPGGYRADWMWWHVVDTQSGEIVRHGRGA